MRLVLAMVLAGLALPLSVRAQDAKGRDSWLERWHPEAVEDPDKRSPEPAPEEPSLELKLDDTAVEVVPPPPRTPDGYTLEEAELRVKRARIGLYVSTGVWVIGLAVAIPGAAGDCGDVYWGYATPPARCDPLL